MTGELKNRSINGKSLMWDLSRPTWALFFIHAQRAQVRKKTQSKLPLQIFNPQ